MSTEIELNWDLMSSLERAKYLAKFCLARNDIVVEDEEDFTDPVLKFTCSDGLTPQLIVNCEYALSAAQYDLYIHSLVGEISAITYEGLSREQIRSPVTARQYYKNLVRASLELKGTCLYWAVRNQTA